MKICIVGASGHYIYSLYGIKKDGNSSVAGICPGIEGEDITKLIEQTHKFGHNPIVYKNYLEMFDTLNPDIAVINSHFYLNAHIAIEAINRGISVYIEKPVATTFEELERLYDAYSKSNVHLSTMFGIRYTPHFWTAWNVVNNGAIGDIRLIFAQKSYKLGTRPDFYKMRNTYGGTIPWVGSHAIDWVWWFSKKKFKNVYAFHSNKFNNNNGDLEVSATCQFTLEEDISALVSLDYLRPSNAPTHDDDRIRVVGTNGIVEIRQEKVYLINDSNNGVNCVDLLDAPTVFYDFISEVRGQGKCMVSAQDAFYITKACLLARQSADEKKVIEF